jgi:hypothetical protein
MTDTTSPPTGSASSGMTSEVKKAAAGFTALGFLLGGPVGGIIAALAVGIEQAFIKAGWDKPGVFGGRLMTAEELAERRQRLAAEAEEYFRQSRARAATRAALLNQHRQHLRDLIGEGRDGDKPSRPDGSLRNPWEFLKDSLETSRAGYRLFDEKMARGNEKVTAAYPAIGSFFRDLWNFITGFLEGTRTGWQQWQAERRAGEQQLPPDPGPAASAEQDDRKDPAGQPPVAEPARLSAPEPGPPIGDRAPQTGQPPAAEPARLQGPEPGPPIGDRTSQAEQRPTEPAGSSVGTIEGDVVDKDGTTMLPAAGTAVPERRAAQGETNLDQIYQAFQPIPQLLHSVDSQLPDLQKQQLDIGRRLEYIRTLGAGYGVPTQVWHCLAEAARASAALANGLHTIALDTARARELAELALTGLRPAAGNLDAVRSQGASGDLFAGAAEVA